MVNKNSWLDLYPEGVNHELMISDFTMGEILERTASRFPDHPAIHFHNKRWTYTELKSEVDLLASALQRKDVKKGDSVAIMLPTSPQYVIAYYAVLSIGGIVVQVNPQSTKPELVHIFSDSSAKVIIALDSHLSLIEDIQATYTFENVILKSMNFQSVCGLSGNQQDYDDFLNSGKRKVNRVSIDPSEDVGVIQYTGGTTGRPKGVMLTHKNLVANIEQHDESYKGTLFHGKERVLIVMPLFHSYGMTICMNLSILQGSQLILLERFDIDTVFETMKNTKPTRFAGVPTMYTALNQHPKAEEYHLDFLKVSHCGGAPLPTELTRDFERKTEAVICEAYGLSEATPGVASNTPFIERKVGSIGIPLPSTEVRIVDIETGMKEVPIGESGEIIVKGPQVMKGYLNLPEETKNAIREGWLYTGDIGKRDEDGYMYIVDRKKEMIIASGFNVYPREIEEVLYDHPDVLEAAVIGVKEDYRGETVKAVITLKSGRRVTSEDIKQYCRKSLSAYKVPKIIEFRDELPKTGVGKILKKALLAE